MIHYALLADLYKHLVYVFAHMHSQIGGECGELRCLCDVCVTKEIQA